MMERTLVIIKPDAVERKLTGHIIQRIEQFATISWMQKGEMYRNIVIQLYQEHKDRPFFTSLIEFMTSGPVVVLCVMGPGIINRMRHYIGKTDPKTAEPGTIRGDFGIGEPIMQNIVHASATFADAERELKLFSGEHYAGLRS